MTAMRQARLFDGDTPGGNGRPPVPSDETDALLTYLTKAPIVLAARGFDRDMIDPAGPQNVPLTYHTDGIWIWSGAVGYYLRVHGVAPEPDLVAHIRGRSFRIPEVPEDTRSAAVDLITGASASTSPPSPAPTATPTAPPVSSAPPPVSPVPPSVPPVPLSVPPVPSADSGGPIEPLPGEPPLTLYRDLREVELPAGTRIDRFGEPGGNVTYVAGTDYSLRSLPPEWADREYHVYLVERPVRALMGVAIPWFEQPGGGTAFILPAAISAHLADGTLSEAVRPQ